MVNAHPSILLSICQQFAAIDESLRAKCLTPNLEYYCKNREKVLNHVAKFLSLPVEVDEKGVNQASEARSQCKKFLTVIFYGSSLENYLDSQSLTANVIHDTLEEERQAVFSIRKYQNEITRISDLFYDAQHILTDFLNSGKLEGRHILLESFRRTVNHMKVQEDDHKNKKIVFLSLLLQDIERNLMGLIEKQFAYHGFLIDVYIHDGFLLRKETEKEKIFNFTENAPLHNLLRVDEWHNEENSKSNCDEGKQDLSMAIPDLLRDCENFLGQFLGIHIELQLKKLDTSQFENQVKKHFLTKKPIEPPLKTYEELKFHYEHYHNLAYVKSRGAWLFETTYYTHSVQPALPENECIYVEEEEDEGEGEVHRNQQGKTKKAKRVFFWPLYHKKNYGKKYMDIEFIPFASSIREETELISALSKHSNLQKTHVHIKYLLNNNLDFPLLRKKTPCQNSLIPLSEDDVWHVLNETNSIPSRTKAPLFTDEFKRSSLFPTRRNLSPLTIPFFNHFFILLGRSQSYFEYCVKYLAKIASKPGLKPEGCGMILYSQSQGNGKSAASKMAASLFAPFSLTTQSLSNVFSRFSDMMENRLVLHIEDAPAEEGTRFNEGLKNRLTASES